MTPEDMEQGLAEICESPVSRITRFAGGEISGASRVDLADGRAVVAKSGPMVEREARMLEAMVQTGAPVPAVLGTATDLLVMEYVGAGAAMDSYGWEALAQGLQALRNVDHPKYGWHEGYALREVAVINDMRSNWADFWRDNRLLCHLRYLPAGLAARVEALAAKLTEILPASPKPALVHGDLWGGNVVAQPAGKVWLIDPCAYYGDREVDAASLTVFDAPPDSFFDALEFDPGWRERQPVYRLWMWLVHVRLFGESYRPAAERDLALLGF